ncbi:HD domain-containing protein [Oribacterium sp. WCC10]|uniref:HD domain-containing protein n=1 Tax=Oribacterium sp. WCC10 TaxID=1855343 RepID=UPI0008EDB797|nr:HD domain-containing protein [Oribacterium sp. WCC10]SFG72093.1 HD domain-containing protein [Oribacterium sp. WCC10]
MILTNKELLFAEKHSDITHNDKYIQLKDVPRHGSTNTFDHSVRVAHMASHLAKYIFIDQDSAIKVGLLHDFCLVDYHKDDKEVHNGRWYCFYHPEDAVTNSLDEGFILTHVEKKAIWSHMFPLSTCIPTSRLGYLLTFCDKVVAIQESFANVPEGLIKLKINLNEKGFRFSFRKN